MRLIAMSLMLAAATPFLAGSEGALKLAVSAAPAMEAVGLGTALTAGLAR